MSLSSNNSTGNGGSERREQLRPASKSNPCPVCDGDHKCSVGDGGLIICGRRDGPVPGFRDLGASEKDSQFHLYRRDDHVPIQSSADRQRRAKSTRSNSEKPGKEVDDPTLQSSNQESIYWGERARLYASDICVEDRVALAAQLGLPVEALDVFPLLGILEMTANGATFTFPEMDSQGSVIGIIRRFPDRAKKAMSGGKRGLAIPDAWREKPGPLLLVEGPTDVLAVAHCQLAAIGRPSNTGGVDYIAELLADQPTDRPIMVIGENDQRPSKKKPGEMDWPGKDGAMWTASKLSRRLNRLVQYAMIPDGIKDARDWICEQAAGAGESVDWQAIGRKLVEGLNPVDAPVDLTVVRVRIMIGADECRVNDEAIAALGADQDLYQRGGQLVRVTCDPPPVSNSIRRPASPRIDLVEPPTLRERMAKYANWRRIDKEEEVPAHPPAWSVQAVHARRFWPLIRTLEAVVEYPLFLSDGRILTAKGFDISTGLLYHPPSDLMISLPDCSGRADAVAAAAKLLKVVKDFPFAGEADKAAWLAALLSPLARFSFVGPTPLFLVNANCRGIGKGLLLDVISYIVTGQSFAVCPYTNDREELRKLMTSIAVEGDRLVLFDNLEGPFGNGILDMVLTGSSWKGRLLGTNTTTEVPLFSVWYGTGNNVLVQADTLRRVCQIQLETSLEKPEQRADFQHADLLGWVAANRSSLLTDALTILSAWQSAGRPDYSLTPWGSYQGWSAVVRNAVMFCGLRDPGETRVVLQARADVTEEIMRAVLLGIKHLDPTQRGLTCAEIIDRVFNNPPVDPADWFNSLRSALEELLPRKESKSLGYKLRHFQRRMFAGLFLDNVGASHGSKRWAVYPEKEFNRIGAREQENVA